MSHNPDFLKGATIEYGSMRPGETPSEFIHLFGLNTAKESYWFEVKLEFAENGNDYHMRVRRFGALGRGSLTYASFNTVEISAIKRFLEEYFSSREVKWFSEMFKDGRFLGMHYADGWIFEGDGERYEYIGPELR
jgi:hypothetical protein